MFPDIQVDFFTACVKHQWWFLFMLPHALDSAGSFPRHRQLPHLFFFFSTFFTHFIISSSVWRRRQLSVAWIKVPPSHVTEIWAGFFPHRAERVPFIFCHIYLFMTLSFGCCWALHISPLSAQVESWFSDWTWHCKSPLPTFKNWSDVGQLAFVALVLSTSPVCQHIRCIPVFLYCAWKGFSVLNLTSVLTVVNK